MPNAETYRYLQSGQWNEINPHSCPCRGLGWMLSDYDTWHMCRVHGEGVPHPDSMDYEEIPFSYKDHILKQQRMAYAWFRSAARYAGFTGNFKAACRQNMPPNALLTPKMWVEAAEDVATCICMAAVDTQAQQHGFSGAQEAFLKAAVG